MLKERKKGGGHYKMLELGKSRVDIFGKSIRFDSGMQAKRVQVGI